MSGALHMALMGATPTAFVFVEALLIVGAIVAAAGAVITAVIAVRAGRRGSPDEEPARRAPSHSSLGMDDDPIVAALVGTDRERRSRFPGNEDRIEP
jgi:hypothetical protein